MPDKNRQAIVDALDVLARGASTKTNGKVTGVNLAKEAGVSKATLYRYFNEFPDLNEAYVTLKRNGIRLTDDVPETLQEAYRLLEQEVKNLRSELNRVKKEAAKLNELKSHQIQLLWMANERLQSEVTRLLGLSHKSENVTVLPTRK
ncbi:MAG: TetR family transcriptional regulator [Betaproteobacteria bacterium]|nr:TetR family transcriptional regulator [Betaproteobacteria bacterium]